MLAGKLRRSHGARREAAQDRRREAARGSRLALLHSMQGGSRMGVSDRNNNMNAVAAGVGQSCEVSVACGNWKQKIVFNLFFNYMF